MLLCLVHSTPMVTNQRHSLTGFTKTSTFFYPPLQPNDQPDLR